MNNQDNIPEYISVSQMAKMLQMSRSRYYQLMVSGVFHHPVYLLSSRRPVYTREIAENNLQVRRDNLGINGQAIVFYSMRNNIEGKKKSSTKKKSAANSRYKDLIEGLEYLGIENVCDAEIEKVVSDCFPEGIDGIAEQEVLAKAFRYIKTRKFSG